MKKDFPLFYSIDDLQDYYQRSSQGHWFDKDTMRFFKTKLTSHFKRVNDKTYLFITTECGPSNIRKATLRACKIKRNRSFCGFKLLIESVGAFNQMSIAQAKKAMELYHE